MCDTIDEILEVIIKIFENKKAYIKEEKNSIFIYLKITLLYGKEQELKLELNKKKSNLNDINEELCIKINNLENETNDLKKKKIKRI